MGDEASQERERSLAAPLIFLIVAVFKFAYYCLDHAKKKVSELIIMVNIMYPIKDKLKLMCFS